MASKSRLASKIFRDQGRRQHQLANEAAQVHGLEGFGLVFDRDQRNLGFGAASDPTYIMSSRSGVPLAVPVAQGHHPRQARQSIGGDTAIECACVSVPECS